MIGEHQTNYGFHQYEYKGQIVNHITLWQWRLYLGLLLVEALEQGQVLDPRLELLRVYGNLHCDEDHEYDGAIEERCT